MSGFSLFLCSVNDLAENYIFSCVSPTETSRKKIHLRLPYDEI